MILRRHGTDGLRIVVRGELSPRYVPAFEGLTLATGDGQTAIVGPVIDQAHPHGLLNRICDLRLELISINPTPRARSIRRSRVDGR
jgi:hypothetical protein